jgi:hypothetical protein
MSLAHCPECGHEVSVNAIACPNCGLPMNAVAEPLMEETTVVRPSVAAPPPVHVRTRPVMPTSAIVALGVLGISLLFLVIFLFRGSAQDSNVNVALNANRRAANGDLARDTRTTTTTVPPSDTGTVSIPPSSTTSIPSTSTSVPSTSAPVSLPPTAPPPDKGSVVIKAKFATTRGTPQPARGVKFYLLDKDVETILSNADVEPISGNTLSGSFGLASVFPDKYGDFTRKAMRALAAHIKYSGSTDGSGTASLNGIQPDEYYLFSITRSGKGFALWNSPVSVVPGENILDLSPQAITEISDDAFGEDD